MECSIRDLFSKKDGTGVGLLLGNEIIKEEADDYFDRLKNQVPWTTKEWKRGFNLPRLVYQYTPGLDHPNDVLDELILTCGEVYECNIYGAWCNYYRKGSDYTPFHQDSYGKAVFTYSFGGSRKFVTQHIQSGEKKEYTLAHGDAFYFDEEFDAQHKHSIPKSKDTSERISIVLFIDKPYTRDGTAISQAKNQGPNAVSSNLIGSALMEYLSALGIYVNLDQVTRSYAIIPPSNIK